MASTSVAVTASAWEAAADKSPPSPLAGLRVAIVHDVLVQDDWHNQVTGQLLALFPQADLFALIDAVPAGSDRSFLGGRPVRTGTLGRLPLARRFPWAYLPLMPLAVEQLDVSRYDVVVSVDTVAAKGVIAQSHQLHICYCRERSDKPVGRSIASRLVHHYLRRWDVRAATGVDVFLSASDRVAGQVNKRYRRRATVIRPPVDLTPFPLHTGDRGRSFVAVAPLVPDQRIGVLVEAFTRLLPDRQLTVIGDGPELSRLQANAGPNVTFAGPLPLAQMRDRVASSAALLSATDDAGAVATQAQACGTPAVVFDPNGTSDYVISGRTGLTFDRCTPEALADVVRRFDGQPGGWCPRVARAHAERFSDQRFRDGVTAIVCQGWAKLTERRPAGVRPVARPTIPGDLPGHPRQTGRPVDHTQKLAAETPQTASV